MKLRIDRSELLTELIPMQGVVERKSTIPVLSHLLLRARDGRLHVAATDLDVSLTSWCEAEIDREGSVAVQARKLLEIVRSLVGEKVDLEVEESNALRIVSGRSRFKIHGLAPDDFPSLPEVPSSDRLEIPTEAFRGMIAKVFFAVSAEESRFQLNGALLKPKDGSIEMVATDGHRLALVETAHEDAAAGDGILIPRKALQELQRLEGSEEVEFRRGEHHLSFSVGRRELICRILEGTFPDYEKVISKENDRVLECDRKRLSEVVQRVSLLSGDRARAIRFQVEDGGLRLSAANPDLGEAVEDLECSYEGDKLALGINPDYLQQFLVAVGTDQVRFLLKDENSQCIGVPVEGEESRYLCVIMPMRL
ncbi:MAG: DNA polymerase III subunit beta [Acidobacteria bacterium]|nr:MAG: DNA polymerase III subunit beta [Acidobacteriota bacterium]REJ99594.1 MAG: DNA polymerase III subunit beta [Acidobacteriota bacterium]